MSETNHAPLKPPDERDRRLLDQMQTEFPLTPRPYAALGATVGLDESEVLDRVAALKRSGLLRQVSAIFDSKRIGYRSLLVAFCALPDQLDAVAAVVSAHPGVSHSYERAHPFNLWFTMTTPPGEDPVAECAALARQSGVETWAPLPALRTFKIGVRFRMGQSEGPGAADKAPAQAVDGDDVAERPSDEVIGLIRVLQRDLPVVARPFASGAAKLGLTEDDLLAKVRELQQTKHMRRFAAVLRHRLAGYGANGMACWDVPDDRVAAVGPQVARYDAVSHCYERRRQPPDWTYNLFAMTHGRKVADVESTIQAIGEQLGLGEALILFSSREFKKERVVYYPE